MGHPWQALVALVVLPYRAEQEEHPWSALVALEALVVLPCQEGQEAHPCLAVREALAA